MAMINERYSAAVHASSLKPTTHKGDEGAGASNTDVLGAMGLADRRLTTGWVPTGRGGQGYAIKPAPLAASLERLFTGDGRAAHEIVRKLAEMARERSFELGVKISPAQCEAIAKACLAWHRDGVCTTCHGLKHPRMKNSPALDERTDCPTCYDQVMRACTGKIPFKKQFRHEWHELAGWLVDQMQREAGRAGPQAMKALAGKMDI